VCVWGGGVGAGVWCVVCVREGGRVGFWVVGGGGAFGGGEPELPCEGNMSYFGSWQAHGPASLVLVPWADMCQHSSDAGGGTREGGGGRRRGGGGVLGGGRSGLEDGSSSQLLTPSDTCLLGRICASTAATQVGARVLTK
jgi:hypothetical protein